MAGPDYPFLFHGRRPADWYEGEWQLDCFLEQADLEPERVAHALAPLLGEGGVERSLRAWRRPELLRLALEVDGRSDRFLDQVERIVRALHAVAPLRSVVARNARAPGTDPWDRWSAERGAPLAAPAFGDSERDLALEAAFSQARSERERQALLRAGSSEGPRAVPTREVWTPSPAVAARGQGRCDELDSDRYAALEPDRRTVIVFDGAGKEHCRFTAPADVVSTSAHGSEVFIAVGPRNLGYGNPDNHAGRVYALDASSGNASVRYTQATGPRGKGGHGPIARVAAGPGGLAVGTLYHLIALGPDGTELAVKSVNACFLNAAGDHFLVEAKGKRKS
ncbi:MAG: hypothetical protein U0263_07995 [Polyangiaceae bacterium]